MRRARHSALGKNCGSRKPRGSESTAWDRTPRSTTSSFITAAAPFKRKETIVTSAKPDAQLAASAESSPVAGFFQAHRGHRPGRTAEGAARPDRGAGARGAAGAVAGGVRRSLQPRARHSHRQRQLSGVHDAGNPGAKRALRGHFLRRRRGVGARSGNRAQAAGESGAALRTGVWQGCRRRVSAAWCRPA